MQHPKPQTLAHSAGGVGGHDSDAARHACGGGALEAANGASRDQTEAVRGKLDGRGSPRVGGGTGLCGCLDIRAFERSVDSDPVGTKSAVECLVGRLGLTFASVTDWVERVHRLSFREAGHIAVSLELGVPFELMVRDPQHSPVGSVERASEVPLRAELIANLGGIVAEAAQFGSVSDVLIFDAWRVHERVRGEGLADDDLVALVEEARELLNRRWRAVCWLVPEVRARRDWPVQYLVEIFRESVRVDDDPRAFCELLEESLLHDFGATAEPGEPLPDEQRDGLILWIEALRDAMKQSDPRGGLRRFAQREPLLLLEALARLAFGQNLSWDGQPQAADLMGRVEAFATERRKARRRKSKKNPDPDVPPNPQELQARFGPDAPLVAALLPVAHFAAAMRQLPLPEGAPNPHLEVRELVTFLASPEDARWNTSARQALRRFLMRLVGFAKKRLGADDEGALSQLKRVLAERRSDVLRAYTPNGSPSRVPQYVLATLANGIRLLSPPLRANASLGDEERAGVHQTEAPGASSTRRKVYARLTKTHGAQNVTPEMIETELARGLQRQRHRDRPDGWPTQGEVAKKLLELFALSEASAVDVVRRALPGLKKSSPRPLSVLRICATIEKDLARRFPRLPRQSDWLTKVECIEEAQRKFACAGLSDRVIRLELDAVLKRADTIERDENVPDRIHGSTLERLHNRLAKRRVRRSQR